MTMSEDRVVMDYVYAAMAYLDAIDPVNDTDRRVMLQAREKVEQVVRQVDQFYKSTWLAYRKLMEQTKLTPFKDYPQILSK
jgi:hypothetical protein